MTKGSRWPDSPCLVLKVLQDHGVEPCWTNGALSVLLGYVTGYVALRSTEPPVKSQFFGSYCPAFWIIGGEILLEPFLTVILGWHEDCLLAYLSAGLQDKRRCTRRWHDGVRGGIPCGLLTVYGCDLTEDRSSHASMLQKVDRKIR